MATTKKAPAKRNVDKAFAKAGKQAKEIKAKAVKDIKALPHPEWLAERKNCSDEEYAEGCKVRELRDQGLAWLAIGNEMGYSAGKTGAGQARRAYKKAFGDWPRTHTEPRGEGRKAKRDKAERVKDEAVTEKLNGMTDTEAADYLAGKWIEWTATAGEGVSADLVCQVGKKPRISEGKHGRYVTFNEADAGSRSIYLKNIFTVSLTKPRSAS